MKQLTIEELKKCASVRNKQKTWISELEDERLYQIFLMLKRGSSAGTIAEHVRGVWKVNEDSSIHSLSQGIQKFKRRIRHLLVKNDPPADKAESGSSIDNDKGIDVLEKNQCIADQLRLRIDKMMREEKELGVSYPNLCKDVQALVSLEKNILKEIDWRLKNKEKIIEEYEGRQQKEIGERFDLFIEKNILTEDSQQRLFKGMNNFLKRATEKAVFLEKVMVNGKETYKMKD